MRTIIAGSRDGVLPEHLFEALDLVDWEITTVLCGEARGADTLGKCWAELAEIPVESYYPDWTAEPKRGGIIRNEEMGRNASALIALWSNGSKGTAHMISYAEKLGLKIVVLYID